MKTTSTLRRFLLLTGSSLLAISSTHAASLTWDTSPGTVGAGDSAVTGGVGTWNTTNGNWTTDAGVTNIAWTNGSNTAVFSGTAGEVTLGSNVTVGGLSFTTTGYSIAPGAGPYKITLGAAGSTGSATSGSIYTSTGTSTISADIDNAGFLLSVVGPGSTNLSGAISGSGGITTVYGGTTTLSGANTYTGKTSISANTTTGSSMSVSSFNSVNGGTPSMASSSLGAPTTVANGTINLGNNGKRASCALTYTGTGETTDRVINLGFNSSSQQTINASGSGLLKFTSAFISNTSGTGTLNLGGTGTGEIVQGLPQLGSGGLKKQDSGTWTLSGTNLYTGPTAVTAGTLLINGDSSGATGAVSVTGTSTFGGIGTIGGLVTFSSGAKAAFTVTSTGGGANTTPMTIPGVMTYNSTEVRLNLPTGLPNGTYTLATSSATPVLNGSFPTPVVDSGSYGTNGSGAISLSGNDLVLTVSGVIGGGNTAPTISDIVNPPSFPSGGNTGALAFTVSDEDPASVTPSGSSSNPTLVPNGNISFGGSGANRTVTVTPVSGLSGSATITVTITDNGALTVQDTFVVTVTDNYLSWAASQVPPVTGGPNGDDDNDGVKNLVEYALVNGGERGELSGNTITFTKRGTPYGSDLTYDIESSIDLVGWGVLAKPPVVENASTISYTFTPSTPVKNFARLKVVQAP